LNNIEIIDQVINTLKGGWIKNGNFADNGDGTIAGYGHEKDRGLCRFCVVGAFNRVLGAYGAENTKWVRDLNKLVPQGSVVLFNDDPNTSLDDVLNLLESYKKTLTEYV